MTKREAAAPDLSSEDRLKFWKQTLQNPPVLNLPLDHPRSAIQSFVRSKETFVVSELSYRSDELNQHVLFELLCLAVTVLYARYSGQSDIILGSLSAANEAGEQPKILPLRISVEGDPTCSELTDQIATVIKDAVRHRDIELDELIASFDIEDDGSRGPLFQSMCILRNEAHALSSAPISSDDLLDVGEHLSRMDLVILAHREDDSLVVECDYDSDVLKEATVRQLAGHLENLLRAAFSGTDETISKLPMLDASERHRLLVEWNQTSSDYSRESPVHALFSEQAERQPDKAAVIFGEDTLSYRELDERSNQLARHLATLNVGQQTPVGLYLERSLEMAVGLLGVLKAGAAYVPLDPSFPKERLAFMVQDANVPVILTQAELVDDMPAHQATVVKLDTDWETIERQAHSAVNSLAQPDSLAYVIYTSGSTGRPKGVQIEHRSLTNFLCSMQREPGLLPEDRLLAVTTLSFDIAGLELYLPWITGATVIVASRDEASDGRVLSELIDSSHATVMQATPATWRMLVDSGWKGKPTLKVLCGGEGLPRELADELLQRCQSLWNVYGPTETTIWSTCERIEPGSGPVFVGRPIANTTVYLLDEHQTPVPTGVPGELIIGGDGVARGYLGRDELTRERFVADPFSGVDGARLYRTGDLARYREDGRLEVLGRLDHQIKLRGFRIELGEIESVLTAHPQIRQAVVVAREDTPGDKRLVAYLLTDGETAPSSTELREHLKAQLPDYMVPAAFIDLQEFPLTPNGKVDRKALPAPEQNRDELDANYVAPKTPIERELVDIWKDVLGVERVGIHDSFFELGGHSLMAARVVSRMRDAFDADVSLLRFFEKPTVAGLSAEISDSATVAEPIPRRSETGPAPLSFAQKRLWFLDKFEEDSSAYHIPMVLRLKGELNIPALETALSDIAARHEALRTVFPETSGEPTQDVLPSGPVSLPLLELSESSANERRANAEALAIREARQPFDLSREVVHFALVRFSDDEHWLLVTFHHIVADNWSLGVFQEELIANYAARSRGEQLALPGLPVQYSDYAEWQRETLKGDALSSEVAYWREQLTGAPAVLDLPTDRPRPAMQSYRGARYDAVLSESLHGAMERLARDNSATLFMVLLAALNVQLSRYAGQQDISVGAPISGRTRTELEKLVGVFINTLVLRTDLADAPSFLELLQRVRDTTLGAFSNQDVPFEKLVEELSPARTLSHSPLFQVMLVVQNAPAPTHLPGGLEVERTFLDIGTAMFDLTFFVYERVDGLGVSIEYSTDLFDESTIGRMAAQLETLLGSIVAEPERRIHELELLPESERHRLLVEWNQTSSDYSRESPVHALFSEQAERQPDKAAVIFGEDTLSYRELDERSNQLARHLATLNVGQQTPVGLYLERSLEMAVGLLGVLKAGAAYVPLDPSFPKERLAFMVQDANVPVILTQAELVDDMPAHQATVVKLDTDWETIERQAHSAVNSLAQPDSLAYVIYTSGSTGRPKGVQIEHRSLTNFLCSMQREPGLLPEDRLLAVTTLSFDIAGLELYLPWITGATVIVASRDEASDGRVLSELIDSSHATVMQATPATWRMLVDSGWKGKPTLKVLCGGEGLPRELADELLQRCQSLWNVYGPTETTIWSTCERIEPGSGPVFVGRPIANTTVYLLDEHQTPVPTGVPGELIIGGDGVARGYLGRDELTRERFVADPFSGVDGARLYRTGDLARYREDGRLEVLGRLDHQIKLRGFRIELGEIESVLTAHPQIRQAVVVAREDTPGDKRLVAYLLTDGETAPSSTELREHLKAQLPDYMVPAAFIDLQEFPLTPNGKVDRKALPAPEQNRDELDANYVAPKTPIERELVDIWKDVLGVEHVGIHDSFFELGGHSLMAARVVSRMRDAFDADVSLLRFFEKPTVAGLSAEISDSATVAEPIPRRSETGPAPLSFAQKRLWFLDKFEEDSSAYHIPMVLRLKGELNIPALETALSDIAARHEALRTVFPETSGEPTQDVLPSGPVSLPLLELSESSANERRANAEALAIREARQPFDLSREVVHFALVRFSDDEHWLLVTFHHIVADNWSLGVFQEELIANYAARSRGEQLALPGLPVQYSDYAEWQRETLKGDALSSEVAYWREQLTGAPAVLDLPTDRPRPAMQSYRGARYDAVLSESLHGAMERLARDNSATLFMVLLAALNVQLSRYAGQQDISVGAPISGRTRTELEKLVGVFINTLVLRTDLADAPSFLELLQRVRDTTLGAFSNQDVPFEKLVEELSPARTLSHSPLFQVMLVVQNAPAPTHLPGGLEVERTFLDIGTAMFDLTFFVYERVDGLGVSIEYSTDLFDESTIGRMAAQLETLLGSIVAEPERRIHELELLPESERHRLLVEWNQTSSDYSRESPVHALFSEQAERQPDKAAVIFGEDTLSYRELDERSNQLARHLATLNVGQQTPVGLYLERSLEMAVGLLGVLKAGAAYVPLDPSFPKERLAFMVQDANVPVILTQAELVDDMPAHQATVVKLDTDWETIERQAHSAVNSLAQPDSLAYVIYTSGSTGRPKGVQIEHRSLTNFLCSMQREPGLLPEDRLLAVTTLSFDIAGLELYLPWITGATVIVASRDEASDGRVLSELIDSSHATVMQATPATWRMLVDSGWKGKPTLKVLCGGEGLPRELADELLQRCQSLWNVYGPTETTIWSTCERIEPGSGPVFVGRPIANTTVYLLDEHQTPVPTGVPGELIIGGDGVARGYLGRDELTRERFVADPFSGVDGARLYRTGDLARYREDGRLEVLGRLDHQIKLRGFRIELGEIESVLTAHPQIRQAVVVAREDTPGDKRLVAYLLTDGETAPSSTELREHLKAQLPDYMVPAAFIDLQEFPLTPNGKVDRKALPAPEQNRDELDANYVAPKTPIERELVDIWKDALGIDQVGIHDSFFELGGHSLMAVRLFAEVEKQLGVRLPLATLFQATTISEFACLLQASETDEKPTWSCIVPIQLDGDRPPLFCIHAEGGEVLFYRDFARLLGSDQPVYGIQALGLDGARPPLESIEEMARHYVTEIRNIQPKGPYYLAGHCYGGVIMFEMAQQLRLAGEDVAFLGMLDGSAARINLTFVHKLRYGVHALLRNPVGLVRHVVQAEIMARLRWKQAELRARTNGNDNAAGDAHRRVGETLDRAYLSYEPKPYPGKITYFMNSERASVGHLKWRELAGDGVELHIFPGTPNTTFVSPSLEILADEVSTCLRAISPDSAEARPTGETE